MKDHAEMLMAAVDIAARCKDATWYRVGCVLCDETGNIVETGYTGELKDNDGHPRHAEDAAISKARARGMQLETLTLYSTLEPCSERASGKPPCVQQIIQSGIKLVVYGAKEPFNPELGINCKGDEQLRGAGIEVIHITEMEEMCLKSVKRGL